MTVDVLNIQGEKTGRTVDLPKEIFGIEPNEHAVYLAIKQYLAHQRQGTHKAKERGEISFSTRKVKRQKGTGTARAGSIRNPLFRKGGRVFGPRPRKYSVKLNKKVKTLARKSAFSSKASEGNIVVVEDFTFDQPKTREFVEILNNLDLGQQKSVFVTAENDRNLYLSGRNLQKSSVVSAASLNTYEILNSEKLVLSEQSIDQIKSAFQS